MEEKFTVPYCRKILGNAGNKLSDQQLETIRDTFIAFSDYVIDSEIEKLRLRKNEKTYENQKINP